MLSLSCKPSNSRSDGIPNVERSNRSKWEIPKCVFIRELDENLGNEYRLTAFE